MSATTTFAKVKKKYSLVNSYFKKMQFGVPDTILEIAKYRDAHGDLPFEYSGSNWVYDAIIERQKRRGVYASQFFTPDATAKRIAEIALDYGKTITAYDVCCGTGQLTRALLSNGFTVAGIELDYELAELCEMLHKIPVQRSDFQDCIINGLPLVVSNPPYEVPTLTAFMQWLYVSLATDGIAVLLIPTGFTSKNSPKAIPAAMSKFAVLHRENMTESFAHTKTQAEIIVLQKI